MGRFVTQAERPLCICDGTVCARVGALDLDGTEPGYEWQESVDDGKKVKNPSYIHAPADELLLAARLLAFHREGDDEDWRAPFTIITRTGEDTAGEVHDRMPVFLTPAAGDTWLDPEKIGKDRADDLLDLLDVESRTIAATLRTRPVSRAVNNVRALDRHDADLIKPATASCCGYRGGSPEPRCRCRECRCRARESEPRRRPNR